MSHSHIDPTERNLIATASTIADLAGAPLSDLPKLSPARIRLTHHLRRLNSFVDLADQLLPGIDVKVGSIEVLDRIAGNHRPGVTAQFAWPRLDTRLGLGIEIPIAHAIVDQLLGFDRFAADSNRQVTPVEFGILTFLVARALDRLDSVPGPFGAWDLTIDRVGPDSFDSRDLGPILTCRWPLQIGSVQGSLRVWMPESLLYHFHEHVEDVMTSRPSLMPLSSIWRVEGGTITLTRGLSRLKVGGVLPIDEATLKGTVASPVGPMVLVCRDRDGRSQIDVKPIANSSSARVTAQSLVYRELTPREPIAVNSSQSSNANAVDIPITLIVELGRVSLTLSRLADMKVGDVIELGRHSREPVELTSNGKLVARGELVQIDTELGVRITNVLL